MRLARIVSIGPGSVWPESEGGTPVSAFRWLHIENRGAAGNDLVVGIDREPTAADDGYDLKVKAGESRVANVSGHTDEDPYAHRIHVRNTGAAAVVARIELADEPIVDMIYTL